MILSGVVVVHVVFFVVVVLLIVFTLIVFLFGVVAPVMLFTSSLLESCSGKLTC